MVSINEYRKIEMTDNLKGGFIPFGVVRYRVFLLIVVDTEFWRDGGYFIEFMYAESKKKSIGLFI